MKRIFFDHASTTPISEEVIATMTNLMRENYGNPSSIHSEGRKARASVEQSRRKVAQLLNASIGEIFFTSGGTESNNMALKGAVRDLGVQRFISSKIEHHCVLHSLESLEQSTDIQIDLVDIDEKGAISYEHLETLLQDDSKKTMVSLMHSNNEIGTMIDLEKVAALCEQYGALFHSDTVQTMGYFPIDVEKTPVHFLTAAAHKFHGPKGVGFIYINNDTMIKPLMNGGSQERNMRAGTENIYGIAGLAKGLELAYKNLEERRHHVTQLRQYMIEQLQENFEGIEFNGDWQGLFHYKVLSVSFPPSPRADLLLLNLDIEGISVSGGSACSSGADAGSHVLGAISNDPDIKMIRFSFSHYNTKEEVDVVLGKLKRILG